MCGIVGCAGSIGIKSKQAFNDLLVFDMIRGKDSVGVFFGARGKHPNLVLKDTVLPWEMLISKEYQEAASKPLQILLGHNRWKTRGKVSAENAHPFIHDHITGVHNGTLNSCYQLPDHTKFDVDSDNLYYGLSKMPIEELYPKLNGALSLVWWDNDRQKLCFVRNDKRPMHMCFSSDMKQLYWASEGPMLAAALKLTGIPHKNIVSTQEHELVEFTIPKQGKKFKTPNLSTLTPFTNVSTVSYVSDYNNDNDWWADRRREKDNDLTRKVADSIARREAKSEMEELKGTVVEFTLAEASEHPTSYSVEGIMTNGEVCRFWFTSKEDFKAFEFDYEYVYSGVVRDVYTVPVLDVKSIKVVERPEDRKAKTEYEQAYGFGKDLTEQSFDLRYSYCAWCDGMLEFSDENLYLSETEALCPTCKNNPVTIDQVKMLIQ